MIFFFCLLYPKFNTIVQATIEYDLNHFDEKIIKKLI